jgi:hypothetical protein
MTDPLDDAFADAAPDDGQGPLKIVKSEPLPQAPLRIVASAPLDKSPVSHAAAQPPLSIVKSEPAPAAPASGMFSWLPSPRALAGGAVRIGGGLIASLLADAPGLGTAAGAALGGGSESLAEKIAGTEQDPAAIAIAGGLGAIPMGNFFKGAWKAAEAGAPLLEKLAILGKNTGLNALKGAGLNVGTDIASRVAHGEPVSVNSEVVPAVIGAGGAAIGSALARRAGGAEPAMMESATARPVTMTPRDLPGVPDFAPHPDLLGVPSGSPVGSTPMDRWLNQPSFEESMGSVGDAAYQASAPARDRNAITSLIGRPEPSQPTMLRDPKIAALEDMLLGSEARTPLFSGEARGSVNAGPDRFPLFGDKPSGTPEPWHVNAPDGPPEPPPEAPPWMPDTSRPPDLPGVPRGATTPDPQLDALQEMLTGIQNRRGELGPPPEPHTEGAPVAPPLEISAPAAPQHSPVGTNAHTGAETPSEGYTQAPSSPSVASSTPSASPVIERLYRMLQPIWERDNAAAPEGVGPNPPQSLAEFEAETRTDDQRSLMWQQRQIRSKIDSGELGFIDPSLAYPLGGAAAGAVAGPMIDRENPREGAVGGAALGAIAGLGLHNPAALRALRYSNLLSGMAVPKKILGDLGEMGYTALEQPGRAGALGSALASPDTLSSIAEHWNNPKIAQIERGGTPFEGPAASVLGLPSRALGAITEAAKDVYGRAGFTPEEAAAHTFTNEPNADATEKLLAFARTGLGNWLMPVAKIPLNLIERGIERTPGLGSLQSVRDWTGASPELALRRQLIGGGAMAAAGAAGAATAPGSGHEDLAKYADALPLIGGGLTVPAEAAVQAGRMMATPYKGSVLDTLAALLHGYNKALPLPTGLPDQFSTKNPAGALATWLSQFIPFGQATKKLYPVPQNEFDTRGLFFGPSTAEIPGVNESVLPRKLAPIR